MSFIIAAVSGLAFAGEPAITGNWVLDESAESLASKHEEALQAALGQLPWAFRPVARGRLKQPIDNCATVSLSLDAQKFSAHCAGKDPFEQVRGSAREITGKDGKPYKVDLQVGDTEVVLSFVGEDGGQRTRYRREGDTLLYTKELVSSWFDHPVSWTVRYRAR